MTNLSRWKQGLAQVAASLLVVGSMSLVEAATPKTKTNTAPTNKSAKKAPTKKAAQKGLNLEKLAPLSVARSFRTSVAQKGYPNIRYTYKPNVMLAYCTKAIQEARQDIAGLVKAHKDPTKATFKSAMLPLERIMEQMGDPIGVFWLLKATTSDKKFKAAGNRCLRSYFKLQSETYARVDLYKLIQAAAKNQKGLKRVEKFLLKKTLKGFIRAGAALPAAKRKEMIKLNTEIAGLSMKFQSNLAQDKTMVTLDKTEVAGVPASVLKGLKKDKKGRYTFRVRIASLYLAFLRNAKSPKVRKKVLLAYEDAQGAENTKLLEKIIALRDKVAKLLGYKTYAHYVLDDRMAKTPEAVFKFFKSIQPKLRQKMDAELKHLLALKKKDNPKAKKIHAWDWRYYANRLKKIKYAIDDEEIRQYFPMNHVIKSVFAIYQTLLGVTFKEIKPAKAWHKDVRLFAIFDKKTKKRVAFFYLDLYPRPGKYTHFAAFGFLGGSLRADGSYRQPVSSVVGNWRRPLKGEDALLSHSAVVTFFHEFGHIMHQTLTRAPYGSLAGTSVKRDFVEAPSQMLENWCWQPSILKKLSKHHKTGKPLSDALIQKMLSAKYFNSGLFWSRQLFYATVDMTFHTSGPTVDTANTWRKVVDKVMPVARTKGTRPASGFGHLMGYAAGYYGYLWSKVYAQDMFTRFQKAGLLSQKIGGLYRKWILEPGGTMEPIDLVKGFLGRKPQSKAFYKALGIK